MCVVMEAPVETRVKAGAVTLECHLHSRSEGTTEAKYLTLPALPVTALDLKYLIQGEFSVPACVQSLAYQTEVLTDDVELATVCLRSGDTVDVTFFCRGDCHSLEEVVAWIMNLIQVFDENERRGKAGDYSVEVVIFDGIQSNLDAALGYDLFEWLLPRTMVNKAYFECSGGLSLLLELYRRLFRREWSTMGIYMKYLENVCTQAFANYGETAGLRRKLVKMGVLELCFKSLLRVCIEQGQPVTDPFSSATDLEANNSLLKAEMDNALHLLCCFSELPECQLPIASQPEVMRQTVCMALSPTYPCPTKALASEVLLCLAHTPATHQFLATDFVISSMIKMLTEEPNKADTTPNALVGLRCFTLVWMAILILQSPGELSSVFLPQIQSFMTQFLTTTTREDIRTYESDRGTIWATLMPYVKQAYLPNTFALCTAATATGSGNYELQRLVNELQVLSLKVILLFLHSKVSIPMYNTLLVREDLLDFVVCLPWSTPPSCRPEALSLTSDLCTSMPNVGPPRLCNLAKAQLAKVHLGLEKILEMTVSEIANYYYTELL